MVLLHAIVAVIHAVLQSAADALIAGFSLLIMILVILAIIAGLIVALTGCLGFGGIRWFRRRRNGKDDCD